MRHFKVQICFETITVNLRSSLCGMGNLNRGAAVGSSHSKNQMCMEGEECSETFEILDAA